jgi:hypothetical protein
MNRIAIALLLLAIARPTHAQPEDFTLTVVLAFDAPPRNEVLVYNWPSLQKCHEAMQGEWSEDSKMVLFWRPAAEDAFSAKRPRVASATCREGRAPPPSEAQQRFDAMLERIILDALDRAMRERRR